MNGEAAEHDPAAIRELAETAKALLIQVGQVIGKLDKIVKWQRRFRYTIIAIIVVVGLVAFLFVRQHQSNLDNCNAGNQSRTQQEQLWNTLFALSTANNNATGQQVPPATKRFLDQFLGAVKTTYAQVDCSQRYPFW